jgi:hypothetical protein
VGTEEAMDSVSDEENVGLPERGENASLTPPGCPDKLNVTL